MNQSVNKDDVVIVSAFRSPIGNFLGSFSKFSAVELAVPVIQHSLQNTGIKTDEVCEVILGQVLTTATGQNPARQSAIKSGLPEGVPALTINQVCGSGLRSVMLAANQIKTGDAKIVVAGGQESMSNAPHAVQMRNGLKMGNGNLIDVMIHDGLTDIFNNYHMGITAENIAEQFNISKKEQDEFAVASQNKAEEAIKNEVFKDEIVPITVKKRKEEFEVSQDEFPRFGVTYDSLQKIRPAFKKDGTVTAGNASGINDGAAILILMKLSEAEKRGLNPLARIVSSAVCGVSPEIMGTGPIPASKKALQKAGWNISDLDVIEANEAFAAQAISVNKEMGWDESKVNINGGAIALGHPIGASGARVLTSLLHCLKSDDSAKKGLATLCIGGGMGIAICVEKL